MLDDNIKKVDNLQHSQQIMLSKSSNSNNVSYDDVQINHCSNKAALTCISLSTQAQNITDCSRVKGLKTSRASEEGKNTAPAFTPALC